MLSIGFNPALSIKFSSGELNRDKEQPLKKHVVINDGQGLPCVQGTVNGVPETRLFGTDPDLPYETSEDAIKGKRKKRIPHNSDSD